jgi:single-strand DNA-binding protein
MASRSENLVILIGNLGRDAETRKVGEHSVTSFSVATSRRFKKGDEWTDEVNWTNVDAWNVDKLAQYLTKGKQVYVKGRLRCRSYDKDGTTVYVTEVIADTVNLLGGGGEAKSNTPEPAVPNWNAPVDDDDVPF